MANTTWKDATLRLDGAAGSLVAITGYCNQYSINRVMNLIDNNTFSDTNNRILAGLAGTTVQLNGMVNSTTDAIFGPLITAATSVTKTFELKAYTSRYYNGEVLLSNIKYSGQPGSLQVFSLDATFDGAVNRTSVVLS